MALIEVELLQRKGKTVINTDHLVRYGAFTGRDREVIGTYLVLSAPNGDNGDYYIHIDEKPDQLERLLQFAGLMVNRLVA